MKQKLLALCLSGSVLFSLAACGPQPEPQPESVQPEPAQPEPAQPEAVQPPVEIGSGEGSVTIDGLEYGAGLVMGEAAEEMDSDPDREIDRAVTPIEPCFAEKLDGTPLSEAFYFYRSTLSDTYKLAYDQLRAGVLAGQKSIAMTVPVPKEDIFDIYKKVIYDGADLFWAETNGSRYYYNSQGLITEFQPGYNDLVNDLEGSKAKMEQATLEALGDMWSLPTDVEKVKYAHDYLTHVTTYDMGAPYNQTAYSPLVNGRSVCAGYSHALQYLLQKVGVPCTYIVGGVSSGGHAWNQVCLGGEYYAMDVTWDDPLGATPEQYYYNYFNITDNTLSATHVRLPISEPAPWAAGTACSYPNAFAGGAYGTDFAAINGRLPEKVSGGQMADNPYLG